MICLKRSFLASVCLVVGLFLAAPACAENMMAANEAATLYNKPDGTSLGKLAKGAKVDVIQTQDEWSKVQIIGWISRSAFIRVPSLLARVKVLTVAVDGESIRTEPGGGSVIGQLDKTTQLEMTDAKTKWVKGGFVAWVKTSHLGQMKSPSDNPRVRLTTSHGIIVIELELKKAPKTVENFLSYVKKGHYENTIFHRVIQNFMIQGGGFTPDFVQKPADPPIPIESSNGLKNVRGTVAMARTNDPNSATSQFFINVVDNAFLDYKSPDQPGYTVFGHVVEGMDVADKIRVIPTGPAGPLSSDVPKEMVIIQKAEIVP